ncbi:hypothetical protein PDE_01146 [Penicillium oxalicum 114-2]|uniref:Uncharacterized protein n=1 Tax=Penicillium oxalicum (strain 114-2 / CGMCC 5302) TaxID=933388 RepID=S7Z6M0_PENO1|nr:hypothetical protein PDE_01146 [Penicillium oxalicum 114-2]
MKQLTGGISSTLRNMKFEMPDDEDTVSAKFPANNIRKVQSGFADTRQIH